ncbi:HNH endonuclease [Idiomarina sp.]|uniref:HNH endonuclease n=1 Tax=Idiomarina sp. TaxID=1874361 RepID=UPI003A907A0E
MRTIIPPVDNAEAFFQRCARGYRDEQLCGRLEEVSPSIGQASYNYAQLGSVKELYRIPADNSDNNDIVVGNVTKEELKELYSNQVARINRPGREVYDKILSKAPNGRCPLCALGYASTLDHYLPKSKYPIFSVTPLNLVPACKDCNTGKRDIVAISAETQTLHPYFESNQIINEQWLYAEVSRSDPPSIRYFVNPPENWDPVSKARVLAHFESYSLEKRYGIEAADELSCLTGILSKYKNEMGRGYIKQHLQDQFEKYACVDANSWKAALFQALAQSEWYCDGGYE